MENTIVLIFVTKVPNPLLKFGLHVTKRKVQESFFEEKRL